jgi:hypothetical protein
LRGVCDFSDSCSSPKYSRFRIKNSTMHKASDKGGSS